MSQREYNMKQVRAIQIIARLRGISANVMAGLWAAEGWAVKWAERHTLAI